MTRSMRVLKSKIRLLNMHTRINSQMAAAVLGLLASTSLTFAQNLVQNGNFDSTTGGSSGHVGVNGFSLDNWTAVRLGGSGNSGSTSFALVGTMPDVSQNGGGISSAYGAPASTGSNNLKLWGNDLPGSPTGGNVAIVEADWGWVKTELQQTITGLVQNTQYTLTFDWAAGQQYNYNGNTQTRWNVRLDGESYSTGYANVASHGFVGWDSGTFTFTYTGTSGSAVLGFLAEGIGGSLPPFALLDNVQLTPVPEPSQYAAALGGLVLVAGVARRLRAVQAK